MKKEKEAVIYGIKTVDDKYHYIGKKLDGVNADNTINKSSVSYIYRNNRIRNVFKQNENTVLVPIKTVPHQEWYDEKLHEVVEKHRDNNPLLNAQWMLDGKRGFWEGTGGFWQGKKRDANTLRRLSESKFQKVVQYDSEGNLLKIWDSGKEAAINVFKDYCVKNGCGCTKLYTVVSNDTLKSRFRHDSYWFKESELKQYFGLVPKKLNLAVLYAEERKRRARVPLEPKCQMCGEDRPENFYPKNRTHCKKCLTVIYKNVCQGQKRSTVVWYNQDGSIKQKFNNTSEAAFKLKTSVTVIQRLCRGEKENSNYILKYGEKIIQPENVTYPDYKIVPLKKPRRVLSVGTTYVKTRTRSTVEQYLRGKLIHVFADVQEASEHFRMPEEKIRRICSSGARPKDNFPRGMYLKLGEKRQVVLNPVKVDKIDLNKIIDTTDMFDDIPL